MVELEDACVAQRDEHGQAHLKQAIGHLFPQPLPGRFWHGVVHQILHHGAKGRIGDGGTSDCRLDRQFCCDLTEALTPNSSALFVLARRVPAETLVESLRRHHGRILRSSLSEAEEKKLEVAAGLRPPRPPSAKELQAMIAPRRNQSRGRRGANARLPKRAVSRRSCDCAPQLSHPTTFAPSWSGGTEAVKGVQAHVVAYRFPSEVCLDGGRAINSDDPDWPGALGGQPRPVDDYWQQVLVPAGYRLKAEILDYPGGVPATSASS